MFPYSNHKKLHIDQFNSMDPEECHVLGVSLCIFLHGEQFHMVSDVTREPMNIHDNSRNQNQASCSINV